MKYSTLTLFICLLSLISGCAGVNQHGLIEAPSHKFSYEAPSGWKRLFSSNAPMTQNDIKIPMHTSVWQSRNYSSITIMAVDSTSRIAKMSQRETIIAALRVWINDHLSKDCDDISYEIVDEKSGDYDNFSEFFELHSDITCKGNEGSLKMIAYSIKSENFMYMFQLAAPGDFYYQDQKEFQKMLASLNFTRYTNPSNLYNTCIDNVNNPDSIVFFAITENNKTDEFCKCVEKNDDYGKCFNQVLK